MSNSTLTSLLYFLAFGFLFYWMMKKGGCGMHAHSGHSGHSGHGEHKSGAPAQVVKDPVCGMDVDPLRAAGTRSAMGLTFYLFSADCLAKFDHDPAKFATIASSTSAASQGKHRAHHGY